MELPAEIINLILDYAGDTRGYAKHVAKRWWHVWRGQNMLYGNTPTLATAAIHERCHACLTPAATISVDSSQLRELEICQSCER